MKIKLCEDRVFAPCAFIVARERADGSYNARDEANTVLVQTDWDYPSLAGAFGWSLRAVDLSHGLAPCDHSGTDGTIICAECGLTALDFITTASAWLHDNAGAVANDPGYFTEESTHAEGQ